MKVRGNVSCWGNKIVSCGWNIEKSMQEAKGIPGLGVGQAGT